MIFDIKTEKKFQYVEVGKGPVLLLLHGLFGALSNFKDVIRFFSSRYNVVVPIMPIYKMPMLRANVDGLSDFVHEFIQHKNYSSVNLLGNSLGGHVALVYALDHPDYVNSLVLTGSSGLYENSMGGSFPKRNDYNFIKERVEYTFYSPNTASKELVDEVYDVVNDRIKAIRIISMAKSAIRHNLRKEIKKIKLPACLIWGKNDKITPPEVAEEFHALLPQSELFLLEECGHAPMMEKPQEFNKILMKFLNKILIHQEKQQ
jgi:pimeloyl-ACP methyl ester carboxylesterase